LLKLDIPGYQYDIQRMVSELSRIWNAFLRGQIIIFFLALIVYSIVLPALGVRYAVGFAFLMALAKFLPYIGPAITWIVMALVTFFQPVKPFGLQDNPLTYAVIVVVTSIVIDQVMDSFITPRVMARTLKVHPAAVLVVAIVASNLLGLLGVVIAAPFLATCLLFARYIMRKMFDLNPWPEPVTEPPPARNKLAELPAQIWRSFFNKVTKRPGPKKENEDEKR
jgi:predicted PurR-regulated permease PerM